MNYPSQIVKLPTEAYEGAIKKYAREGAYIAGDDAKNPWIPFGDTAAIKHFCFDVRTNSVSVPTRTSTRCWIRKSRIW